MRRRLLPWAWVRVAGPSMVPTLKHGDVLLVRWKARVRPDDVVVARFADLPEVLVVKRAHNPVAGGWDVRSDNEFADGDSRTHGVAEVLARVTLVWPANARGLRRVLPSRVLPRGKR